MAKTQREKKLLFVTVLLIVGTLIYLAGTKYYDHMLELQEALDSYEQKIRQQQNVLTRMRQIRSEFEGIKVALSLTGDEAVARIRVSGELDAMLDRAGITSDRSVTPFPPEYFPDLGVAVYRLKVDRVTTTLPALARFLAEVSSQGSLMEVEELEVRNPGEKGANHSIQSSFVVSRIVFLGTESEPERRPL